MIAKELMELLIKLFSIDESKPLHKNPIFWVATILPVFIALLLAYPLFREFDFYFSSYGYNSLLKGFRLPIWISTSSIVFGVTVGRFHGSAQRAATLKATTAQNNFSNYLNHRDHFHKYMQNVADEFDIKIDAFKMYGVLFSKSTPEWVDISLSESISEYISKKFNTEFWEKMKFSAPVFSAQEVNIYFPRFARTVGINAEKIVLADYKSLKENLIKVRKIYRRAMEYGFTRTDLPSNFEHEESGISELIGEFDFWAAENNFKSVWGK